MKPPFIYGRIVDKEHFADREEELEKLKLAMLSGQNVIIYSPRRYGKSSLVNIALEELKGKIYPIKIDCYGILTKKELAEKISSATVSPWKGRLEEIIRRLFKTIKPKIIIGDKIEIQFSIEEEDAAFEEALKLPERIHELVNKRVVVVFDEFQEVANLGKDVLPKMRAEFQKHKGVTYVFVGSKMGMMKQIFHSPSSPFYNFGMHITLKRIPRDKFAKFILKKFEESELAVEAEVIEEILNITKGHPHYTQMLCQKLWLNAVIQGKKRISREDLEITLNETLNEASELFEEIWDSLTPNQRKVLIAIARREKDFYSRDFLNRYGFKRSSTVQAAIKGLKDREIIIKEGGKYLIENPILELWVKRRF